MVDSASFLVTDNDGPLVDGELERARRWGAQLARVVTDQDQVR